MSSFIAYVPDIERNQYPRSTSVAQAHRQNYPFPVGLWRSLSFNSSGHCCAIRLMK